MSYNTYHKYFRENSMYSFRQPRTDVCDFCTKCKILLEANPKDSCKVKYQLHLKKIEAYNRQKKEYIDLVKNSTKKDVLIIEFDYAQNLPLPKLNITSQFYKRLLWLYNFNVHCHNDGTSSFYCFLETDSKKGSNTICSFVNHFVAEKMNEFPDLKKIIFFSDACGGQNKNMTVVMFSTWLANSLNIEIEHIFPVRGHSYNQCDRNFGRYAILLKSLETIETAEQYLNVMSSARKNPSPFNVMMASFLIEDWHTGLQSFLSKMPTCKKNRFGIQQYVKLHYSPHGVITTSRYYTASDQEYTFKKNTLPANKQDLKLQVVKPVGIKDVKKNDVLSLTPFLAPENAEWLRNVLTFEEGSQTSNRGGVGEHEAGPSSERSKETPEDDFSDFSNGSSKLEEY